jgi:hypothetical protein
VFAQAPMPDTIDRALDALAERYDMPLPMGDLFYGSPERRCCRTPRRAAMSARRRWATRRVCA